MRTGRRACKQASRHASSRAGMNEGGGGGSRRPNGTCVDLPLPKPPPPVAVRTACHTYTDLAGLVRRRA